MRDAKYKTTVVGYEEEFFLMDEVANFPQNLTIMSLPEIKGLDVYEGTTQTFPDDKISAAIIFK